MLSAALLIIPQNSLFTNKMSSWDLALSGEYTLPALLLLCSCSQGGSNVMTVGASFFFLFFRNFITWLDLILCIHSMSSFLPQSVWLNAFFFLFFMEFTSAKH